MIIFERAGVRYFIYALLIGCFAGLVQAEPTLTDLEGHKIPFSSLKGKWVFINYWASWCPSCLNEIPTLNQFYTRYQSKVALYAVNYESAPLAFQRQLLEKYGIHYPSLGIDPRDALKLGDLPGLPVTFVFNPQGEWVETLYGEQSLKNLTKVLV